ncbi:hypothetical protein C8R46DRAFT_1108463 [Mycena filopes]|nr:hypothetical protein C8R46DRAFT_1108463 [Mycena filopes]
MSSSSSDVFDHSWLVGEISGTCVQLFAYGICVNLFILAIHILRRRKAAGNTILLTSTCLMCVLATTQIVLRLLKTGVVIQFVEERMELSIALAPSSPPQTYNKLILAHALVLAVNNLLADTLLLYRCYVIWGARWIVIVLPGILIVATFVTGSAGSIRPEGPIPGETILATATNLLLLILTVGRIWWMRRNALHVGADRVLIDRYTTVMAMLLESGALYILPAILIMIVYPWNIPFHILEGLATYLVSIIPTVIIVRVGLGRSIHDTIERRVTRHRIEGIHAQSQVRSAGPVSLPVLEIKEDEKQEGAESIV